METETSPGSQPNAHMTRVELDSVPAELVLSFRYRPDQSNSRCVHPGLGQHPGHMTSVRIHLAQYL